MSFAQTLALVGSLAASASAHGFVSGIVAAGTYYQGYNPSFQYQQTPPTVAGWSDPENLSNGFIAPAAFADPDIICHLSATPGGTSLKVSGGDTVELQWNTWPESHHGPVIDYLAKCSGDCTEVDKTTLEFFKISEGGLIDGSTAPGKWASDDLIANNNTWSVTIPNDIASGNYVLRHEIIALHSAGDANGAQNYPQCVNLEITSGGSEVPAGTLGTALYKEDDPGIKINIYTALSTYTIPGPALYDGAAAPSQTAAPSATGSSSSYVEASTTAAATSAASAEETYAPSTTASAEAPTPTEETESGEEEEGSDDCWETVSVTSTSTIYDSATESPVYATATATATAIAVPSSSAEAEPAYTTPAPAADSAIASIIDAVPTEALTSTIPTTIVPSATSTASPTGYVPESQWGDKPSKPLPAGWTLKDLLQWVSYLVKQSFGPSSESEGGVEKREHARDFSRVNELPYTLSSRDDLDGDFFAGEEY